MNWPLIRGSRENWYCYRFKSELEVTPGGEDLRYCDDFVGDSGGSSGRIIPPGGS